MARTPCRVTMIVKTVVSAPACAKSAWICDARTNAKTVRIARRAQAGRFRRKKMFALMIRGPRDEFPPSHAPLLETMPLG